MNHQTTKGQIEDKLSKSVTKFYLDTLGTGPKESKVYILHDMIIVRLKGKLLPIEQKLLEARHGISLIKDIRKALHEITADGMGRLIKEITGKNVLSSHSDISTKTGEILQAYILDADFEKALIKSSG